MHFIRINYDGFDLDTVSWITPRLAVTNVHGAGRVFGEDGHYVINTAREVNTPCDYKLAVAPFRDQPADVRVALDTLARVIHEQIEKTTNSVVVHCFAGIERSVLTCVWYLCKHNSMSMDEAYKTVTKVRPVALDRREWARG